MPEHPGLYPFSILLTSLVYLVLYFGLSYSRYDIALSCIETTRLWSLLPSRVTHHAGDHATRVGFSGIFLARSQLALLLSDSR
jgi:hypothetical protein